MVSSAIMNDVNSLIPKGKANVYHNLSAGALVEQSIRRGETHMASDGAIVGERGKRTGRSLKDKFIVEDAITADMVICANVSQSFSTVQFDALSSFVHV